MGWQTTLAEIRARKLELVRLDPRSGMPVCPPPGADPRAIAAVQRKLGRPLPPSFRAFLAQHDGFPQLYQGTSLLASTPLARGTFIDLARVVIETEGGDKAVDAPALFPLGVDARGETLFAWDPSQARGDGEIEIIVWMNEIGLRVESFPALLEVVLEMLAADIAQHREKALPGSVVQKRRSRMPVINFKAA